MKAQIILNVQRLVENIHVTTSEKDYSQIEYKITEMLLKAVNGVSAIELAPNMLNHHIEEMEQILKEHPNSPIEIEASILSSIISELRRLQQHEVYTVGLWAIDRKPKKVSYKWIKKQAFRIKKNDSCL